MGFYGVSLSVTGKVHAHHDERDDEDREAWHEFVERVRAIAAEPRYGRVVEFVDYTDDV